MADNLKGIPFSSSDEGDDKVHKAKRAVMHAYNCLPLSERVRLGLFDVPLSLDKIYIVKFSYILGHWKGFLSTTLPDGMYYEVTHNSDKKETYVDGYLKVMHEILPDEV